MSSSVKSVKCFCKVCFDAGKSESEYSSHFVRNERGGKVVCPTLLNLNCTYCHKKGHTKSYCKDLKKDQKRSEKSFKRFEFETKGKTNTMKKVEKKNVFAALDSDGESEGEEDYPEEFPALSANVTIRENKKKVSFAEMAMKPAAVAPPVVAPVVAAIIKEEVEVPTEPRQQRVPMRSWAEWSDSEDEEEFEANGYPERKGYQGYVDETDW